MAHEMNPRKALLYWFLGQPVALGSQIFIMIYTARILGPEEKGLFVAAVSALAFLQILQNFGLGAFLVSKIELTTDDISTAFGILLIGCLAVAIGTYTIASPLAEFVREPRLVPIFHVLAIAPIFMPLQMIAVGLMMREHRSEVQLILTVGRALISSAVVYIMCEKGFGAISLAWAFVAGTASVTVLAVIFRPSVMLIKPSLIAWKSLLRFGSGMLALSYLVNLLPRLYEFLITRSSGVLATGLFSQMLALVDPIKVNVQQVVLSALFPTFSEYIRKKQALGPLYLKLIECLTGVLIPIYVVMAILGKEIVLLLFGPQWVGAANILVIIYCAQIATTLAAGGYDLFLAMGRVKTLLIIETVNFGFSLLVFWIGLHSSLSTALYYLIVAAVLYSLMYSVSLIKSLNYSLQALIAIYVRTALVVLAAAIPPLVLKTFFPQFMFRLPDFLLVGFASFALAYCVGKYVKHELVYEINRVVARVTSKFQ